MYPEEIGFLPQYTLDRLAERVCLRLDHFSRFDPATMWRRPIENCRIIEKEPRQVSSVILQAKKNQNRVDGTTVMDYHQFLTRIYVLLYYRHHKRNPVIEAVALPQLVRNMGIYAKNVVLTEQIQREIDQLLEEDQMVADAMGQGSGPTNDGMYAEFEEITNQHGPRLIGTSATSAPAVVAGVGTVDSADAIVKVLPEGAVPGDDDLAVLDNTTDGGMHDKVRYELFLRLMELAGLDLNDTGNKSGVGRLWHALTGKSAELMRRFCSYRKYQTSHTSKDIDRLNELLAKLGIDMQL